MVRRGVRTAAAPVAAKIGADDRKVTGKQRRDVAPHQVCLRKTVQQEDRGSGAAGANEYAGLARLDLQGCASVFVSKWEGEWDAAYARKVLDTPEDDLEILTEDEREAAEREAEPARA